MISYLLSNGKSGDITDPWALRAFYTRLYYAKTKDDTNTRRRPGSCRPAAETR
jgi:outer membrane receptor for ferric coprogen and ferric-rhodotorulic acid